VRRRAWRAASSACFARRAATTSGLFSAASARCARDVVPFHRRRLPEQARKHRAPEFALRVTFCAPPFVRPHREHPLPYVYLCHCCHSSFLRACPDVILRRQSPAASRETLENALRSSDSRCHQHTVPASECTVRDRIDILRARKTAASRFMMLSPDALARDTSYSRRSILISCREYTCPRRPIAFFGQCAFRRLPRESARLETSMDPLQSPGDEKHSPCE